MGREPITAERLRELVSYHPETGLFYWRVEATKGKKKLGGLAVHRRDAVLNSYLRVAIGRTKYYAHRLAWLYVYGRWPEHHIDHINGDRGDNRLCNLREATRAQNLANMRNRHNSCGYRGVGRAGSGRWVARIRDVYLGIFDTPEDASAAYQAAAEKHYGEFARHVSGR